MTATLDSLSRQIRSAEDLASVVRTMKTLAAVSIRQYEEAVDSLREYRCNVEDGLRMLLSDASAEDFVESGTTSSDPRRELAVICGSDQGMCGQFNQQIVSFVGDRFSAEIPDPQQGKQATPLFIVVGHRCGSLLEEAGFPAEACLPEAGSVGAVIECVQDVLTEIDRVRNSCSVQSVALYFSQRTSATVTEPHRTRVLPVKLAEYSANWADVRQSRSLPMHTLPRAELLSSLLREYLFVSLFRACAESLSSENAARIQSMQTAERNITERLQELRSEYNQSRQTSITEELLDVVGGFEVLKQKNSPRQSN